MNTCAGGPWRFRWGKKAVLKSLAGSLPGASVVPGRLFRGASILGPVLAWIAGIAVKDLRQPDSRIKAFARSLLEKKRPYPIRAVVIGQQVIEGPDKSKQAEEMSEPQEVPEE